MSTKSPEQKRARRLQSKTDWSYSECLRCVRTGTKYLVDNPRLSEDAMAQVQEEVFKVLGWS